MDKNLLGGSTVLMLLSLLSEGDRYGYDIIRELAARSENVFGGKGDRGWRACVCLSGTSLFPG